MAFLEREPQLATLESLLREASGGQGRLAFVGGEAGVGKSSLVARFCAASAGEVRVAAVGACDPVSSRQALAPLLDVAGALGGEVPGLIARPEDRDRLFRAVLERLSAGSRPTLLVLEDVHWGDDATLDLLRYLGRRVGAARALLLATYRDDEVGPLHPLRVVLGDLATSPDVRRLALSRLSEGAVRELAAGSGLDARELHRRTGGNPFYVTEAIAAGTAGVPDTVQDAVLARASRLAPGARSVLEAAAVLGPRAEPEVLLAVAGAAEAEVEACLAAGMLREADGSLDFRHDLAREAVLLSIPLARRTSLHRAALAVLEARGASDAARLAHHAEGAGNEAAVLRYAVAAAEQAASLHSHREAAAQYGRAARQARGLAPAERARLLEGWAQESWLTDANEHALSALREARALWRELGERTAEGRALTSSIQVLVRLGRIAEAEEASRAAIAMLEVQPPSAALATALKDQCYLRMLDRDLKGAVRWGERAAALAERLGERLTWLSTMTMLGAAQVVSGDERGLSRLEECRRIASEEGYATPLSVVYLMLGSGLGEVYDLRRAERYLDEGIAFSLERDLESARSYMTSWRSLVHLHRGRWNEAAEDALAIVSQPGAAAHSRVMALLALGRLRARRGDPGAWAALDEALELSRFMGHLQRLAPVHAARAEAAWLAGDLPRCRREAEAVLARALERRHAWFTGELSYWAWRAGAPGDPPAVAAAAFRLEMLGDWDGAAREWERLGCPYEAARARLGGDEAALREALAAFERLGARPTAAVAARRLRELGAHAIPRGPRSGTRANPGGLTARELQVAHLLAEGRRNTEIAEELGLSLKTIDHHVSAVLAKLEVRSRTEAAVALARLERTPS